MFPQNENLKGSRQYLTEGGKPQTFPFKTDNGKVQLSSFFNNMLFLVPWLKTQF